MSALTSLLVRDEVVSVRQIEDAIARQVLEGGELDTALLELDAVPENVLNAYRAASFRLPAVARDEVMSVSAATLSLITESQAQRLRIIPITHDATTLVVAAAQPMDESGRAELSEAIGMRIESCICCEVRIEAALASFYGAFLAPRMQRLAERVERLEPGSLPLVEAMQETPISGLAAELFDDFDESDELEEPPVGAMPIAPESLRPKDPHEVSVGRVVEVRPSQLPPADGSQVAAGNPSAEPSSRPGDTQRGVGYSSVPAPGDTQNGFGPSSAPPLTSVPATSAVRPENLTAGRSGRAANDIVFSKPARKPKRGPAVPQGPLTRELASQLLQRADDRDAVIEVFFRYARQYFEATALCSVREDRVLGREVHNVPNLTDIHDLTLSVQRGSGLEEVLRTLQPRVDDMSRKAEDQPLVEALRRMACQPSALLPVCIKRRVVAIIYGDRGGDYFQRSDLAQLVELLPEVSRSFERIIRTRKVLGLSTRAQSLANAKAELGNAQTQLDVTPPTLRAEPPDHAKAEALLKNARRALSALGVPRTAPPPPAAAPRVGPAGPQPSAAPRAAPAANAPSPAVSRAPQPAVAGMAPMPTAAPGSSAQYNAVSGPDSRAAASGGFEGALLAAASALEARSARPALRPEPAPEPANDSTAAAPSIPPEGPDESAVGPRAFDQRASTLDAHEAISGAMGALEQLERLPTARLPAVGVEADLPAEPESPAPRRPAYLSKPPPGAGRYSSLREGDGEESEIPPESDTKRMRQQRLSRQSNRPRRSVPPEPVSATADTQATLPRFESPRPEPLPPPSPRPSKPPPGTGLYKSRSVSSDVVSLSPPLPVGARRSSSPASPAASRRSQRPPAAAPSQSVKRPSSVPPAGNARRSSKRPPPPPDDRRDTPLATPVPEFVAHSKQTRSSPLPREATVIVDTLGQTRALVDDLCKCGPDDEGPTVQSLLRVGSEALDVLIERFPGPLWFDRRRPYARLPFGRDTGPIARALSAFGPAALLRIHPLLRSNNPDVRYYATLFVSDQVHPELLVPIAERLFDDDPQIRLMVRDTLPAYRQLPAFTQVLGSLRTRMLEARAPLPTRLAAIDALTHLRDGASVLPLVELLAHPDRQLSVPAHRALVAITCQDFGSSTKKWRLWYEENQHRHRVQWLVESLMHSEQNLRSAAGIELQKVTQVYYGYVASAPKRDRERAQRRYQDWWENEGHKRF